MGMVCYQEQMDQYIWESGRVIFITSRAFICILTVKDMRVRLLKA